MKHFFSLLAVVAALCGVAGCQTGRPKAFTAAKLEIGAPFETITYHVEDGMVAVLEIGHNGRILAQSHRKLTAEEEENFWKGLEQLQVREWRRDYGVAMDERGLPVTQWRLTMRRGKAVAISQGIGTFPGDEAPSAVVKPDTSTRFQNMYGLFQKTMEPGAPVQSVDGGLVGTGVRERNDPAQMTKGEGMSEAQRVE